MTLVFGVLLAGTTSAEPSKDSTIYWQQESSPVVDEDGFEVIGEPDEKGEPKEEADPKQESADADEGGGRDAGDGVTVEDWDDEVEAAESADASPVVVRTILENGLELVVHVDRRSPAAMVSVTYYVGGYDDEPAGSGIAHLLEHMLFRRSEHSEGRTLSELVGTSGPHNGFTTDDRTTYFEVVPAGQVSRALWVEAQRMGFGSLLDDDLELEKNIVAREFALRERTGFPIAFQRALSPSEEAVIGEPETLKKLDVRHLWAFYRRWYAPNNATVVVVGDVDPIEVERAVVRWFGGFKRRTVPKRRRLAPFNKTRRLRAEAPARKNNSFALVYQTGVTGFEDEYPLDMLVSILGDACEGRLAEVLKCGEEVAQVGHETGAHRGYFGVSVTMSDPSNPEAVAERLEAVLRGVVKSPPTAEEMAKARRVAIRSVEEAGRGLVSIAMEHVFTAHNNPAPFSRVGRATYARTATGEDLSRALERVIARPRLELQTFQRPATDRKGEDE